MKKQFSKLLPFLAIAGGIFICSCGDTDTPEGIQSRQKGEDCDQEYLCMSGLVCEAGKCRVICSKREDCGSEEHCENNRCVANLSTICPEGFGGKDGKDCSSCLKRFYGDLCEPCDCQHGECWDGKSGNGQCKTDTCAEGWAGSNCDRCADNYATKDCIYKSCKNGTANLGLDGDGHCVSCDGDWSGTDCDLPKTCKNGTPNLGLDGDGHCSSCDGDWSGTDCDLLKTCKNGTPNIGVNGNGECSSCFDKWDGSNCDVCPAGFYDGVTDCVDCTKGVNTAFGTDKCRFTDIRTNSTKTEQNTYKVVTINGKFWMAENLKATKDINGNAVTCYANTAKDTDYVKNYGCLYVWNELATVNNESKPENTNRICPSGWHLPEDTEFNELLTYVANNKSSSSTSFLSLIAKSAAWKKDDYKNKGLDEFGFGALPAGDYLSGNYYDFGDYGGFWSSTELNSSYAYYLRLGDGHASVNSIYKALGISVRCLKDSN